ncbi:MAG: hypothetical protein JST26_10565 [Bacteroidetes bacterium]|nr:hypothetical protein [Bacteroidota bacterium]
MAFNIMAEASNALDYELLHKEIYEANLPFDFVPMKGLGIGNGDAIGICVPLRNANYDTWIKLESVLLKLKDQFACDVYDLYGGQKLDSLNMASIRQNLLGE